MAVIVGFDLNVSEKGPFQDKMVIDKCISKNDTCMQIHQLKGDRPTFISNNIHAEQA